MTVKPGQLPGRRCGHTILLLSSTAGFPNVSAALSWVEDLLED